MPDKVYRTAIYCRLSREDGDKVESNSIASQRAICEDYIARHDDLELVCEPFVDDGYSGVSFNRPQFKKLEEAIRKGALDCIVVKDLSRFSRNYIDGGRYIEKIFPQLGIRFIAINDAYDSLTGDPQSDSFVIPFKNLINDSYCKDISMKIRSSLEVKQKSGEFVGSFAPYGYMKSPENKNQLIVDEAVSEYVQMIFSMYKDGFSIGRIAKRLNQMGVLSPMEYKHSAGVKFDTVFKTSDTAKWTYKAVQRILTNEVYIGVLAQGKRGTPNYKVRVVKSKDESEWVKVENAHEALVSYEDFMAVKVMMQRDMRCSPDQDEAHLFSGFLFCGDCQQPMIRKTVPSKTKKYIYYVCSTNKHSRTCSPHSIAAKEVEEKVFRAIHDQIELVINLEHALAMIERLPSQSRKAFNYEAQIAKIEEEIERYQKLKLGLYENFIGGVIDKSEYFEFRNSYTKIIEGKQDALLRVKKEMKQTVTTGTTERNWVTLFKQYENVEDTHHLEGGTQNLDCLRDSFSICADHRLLGYGVNLFTLFLRLVRRGRKNLDSLFALHDLTVKVTLPRGITSNIGCLRLLHRNEQRVVERIVIELGHCAEIFLKTLRFKQFLDTLFQLVRDFSDLLGIPVFSHLRPPYP